MTKELEDRIDGVHKELKECKETTGERMVKLELANAERLVRLETQMSSISAGLTTFVSHHQFAPVKLITYGLAGGVLTTFLGAVMVKILGFL